MRPGRHLRNEDGVALLMVLLIALVVGAMALTAVAVGGNAALITLYEERQDELEAVADAGLELARAQVNGNPGLFPAEGFATLEDGVSVFDAARQVIPGVARYTYVGPTGVATGQFGVFGTIVSVARAPNGDRVVRRGDLTQESFAKYAYFTDVEPEGIAFGSGDVIQGPVHSNDALKIHQGQAATFRGPGTVTTAETFVRKENGTFHEGLEENVARIELPPTAELTKLAGFAAQGSAAFTPASGGNPDEARLRIEFVAIDLDDADNVANGPDEGFFRVYESAMGDWLMANVPGLGWPSSENCGWRNGAAFVTPKSVNGDNDEKRAAVQRADSRCYPGGDPELRPNRAFAATDAHGSWRQRGFALSGNPPAALTGRADYPYLFPLGHRFNPNFKGVIHVGGKVAISGTVRGRVTLAATGDIFIVDDLRYANNPGTGNCLDILGLFGGNDIRVADNTINTPQRPNANNNQRFSYDDTRSEFVDAVVLALSNFTVDNYGSGPTTNEPCEGTARGRGCLYLAGGIIQRERGGVGTTQGHGYLKRYSYDQCAGTNPPPYFPTTGRFSRTKYVEIDPVGFEPAAYYARWTAGG